MSFSLGCISAVDNEDANPSLEAFPWSESVASTTHNATSDCVVSENPVSNRNPRRRIHSLLIRNCDDGAVKDSSIAFLLKYGTI